MTLTPRQRVLQAIRHEEPDRVPWHFTFTVPARKKAEAHYGTTKLDELLGNHLAAYRPLPPGAWQEERPDYWRDEFGVLWNRTIDRDVGVVEDFPAEEPLLDRLRLSRSARYEALSRIAGFRGGQRPSFSLREPCLFTV